MIDLGVIRVSEIDDIRRSKNRWYIVMISTYQQVI